MATAAISVLLDAGVNIRTGAHVIGIDDRAELCDAIFTHPTSTEAIGEVLSARRPARANPHAGRDRSAATGFTWIGGSPQPDVDEFIRGERIVHNRYADDRVLDVMVNGQSLFNRERLANRGGVA